MRDGVGFKKREATTSAVRRKIVTKVPGEVRDLEKEATRYRNAAERKTLRKTQARRPVQEQVNMLPTERVRRRPLPRK